MTRLIDLMGQDIAGWHVLSRADNDKRGSVHWWCRCLACGAVVRVHGGNLRSGKSRRCRKCGTWWSWGQRRPQRHPVGSATE